MNIRFQIANIVNQIPNRKVVYRPKEFSIDTVPASAESFSSVLIDDLNLEIDETGRIVSVWGMCPHTRWKKTRLSPPKSQPGDIRVVADQPMRRGISLALNPDKYLPTYVDLDSGWIQVKGNLPPAVAVSPFPAIMIELAEEGLFSSLWLRPDEGLASLD